MIPEVQKVLKVGWVGTGPFSFYGIYNRTINNIFRDYNFLNMRITHIWGDDYSRNYKGRPEWVKENLDFWADDEHSPEGLAQMCGIPNVCDDYHDMVDEVDAAMIMDFDRSYELAEPFLRRGLPLFICSPVAVSIPECERILNLAAQTGSAIYSGSFTTDMHENLNAYHRVKRDDIAAFYADMWHHFYTSYANDGLEPVHRMTGGGVKRVSLYGWNGSSGYDPDRIPVSRIHLEYEPRNGQPPIQGTLTLGGHRNQMEWFRVYYHDHSVFEERMHFPDEELGFRDFLIRIQEVFSTNKSLETHDDILQKLRVVIAGYKSANEGNRPVDVSEIGDYRLPTVRIEHWDEIPD